MKIKHQKLFQYKKSPIVLLTDNLTKTHSCNGVCAYYGKDPRPCTIIIDSKSSNPSKALIHECIHTVLFNISNKSSLKKISHKINRREDFIEELSEELSRVLKFKIKNSVDLINETSLD